MATIQFIGAIKAPKSGKRVCFSIRPIPTYEDVLPEHALEIIASARSFYKLGRTFVVTL